jgi:hypothetical protein
LRCFLLLFSWSFCTLLDSSYKCNDMFLTWHHLYAEMDISESSITIRGRGKNKRKWIPAEDDELIKALVDVSLDLRWRSDGSFKNGYTSVLEARLVEKLPNARISAALHIESRLRYFKTKYSALEQMLNKSGFTWDPTKKMLQCEKQQYETHCKVCCLYVVVFSLNSFFSKADTKDMAGYVSSKAYMSWLSCISWLSI